MNFNLSIAALLTWPIWLVLCYSALSICLLKSTLLHLVLIGSNCPGMSRTVLDLLTLSCVLDSPAICPGCWSSRVSTTILCL